jgi:hypothetical protein
LVRIVLWVKPRPDVAVDSGAGFRLDIAASVADRRATRWRREIRWRFHTGRQDISSGRLFKGLASDRVVSRSDVSMKTSRWPLWKAVVTCVVTTVIFTAAVTAGTDGFSGSGNCSGGNCNFCGNVTLQRYDATYYQDRCAYGYFVGADTVFAIHDTGATRMCAGMKTGYDGSGTNAGPMGFSCSSFNVYQWSAGGTNTAGYATIANRDDATHYNWLGQATY